MMLGRSESPARKRRLTLLRSERGAILIHTAIAFVGLTAFTTFVADYGMLWTARRQAQNSADAAALAAASSLGYVGINNLAAADAAAITAAQANLVWGQAPDITADDVDIIGCPADVPANGGVCVRADVFRNQARSNPLPTWFGSMVGVSTQGVRATATAQVRFGRASAECVKPLAIPDKWDERQTPPWDLTDRFDILNCQGNGNNCSPFVLPDRPDLFIPGPRSSGGTGFTAVALLPDNVTLGDLGLRVTIKFGQGRSQLEPGMYAPVRLGCSGRDCVTDNITGCYNGTVSPGDQLGVEPGGKSEPIARAFDTIVARDPTATWTGDVNGLGGGVTGGCSDLGTCGTVSPRVIPVIAFDPNVWSADPNGGPGAGNSGGGGNGGGGGGNCQQGDPTCDWNGPGSVTVTQIIGVFVEQVRNNNQIIGRLTRAPTLGLIGTGTDGDANIVNIVLVR